MIFRVDSLLKEEPCLFTTEEQALQFALVEGRAYIYATDNDCSFIEPLAIVWDLNINYLRKDRDE